MSTALADAVFTPAEMESNEIPRFAWHPDDCKATHVTVPEAAQKLCTGGLRGKAVIRL